MTTASADKCDEVFTHPALMYRNTRDYLRATVGFIREGLDGQEPVLVAVPPSNLALLRDSLGDDAARVDLCDMSVAGRNPGRIIGDVLLGFANKHADQHVRVIGEPIWAGRSAAEYPACVQHEALINIAFMGRNVTILCPYNTTDLDPSVIRDAERTHPVVWADGGRATSADYVQANIATAFADQLAPVPASARHMRIDRLNLAHVRAFTAKRAAAVGLSRNRAADAVVVVNELVANTLVHSGGTGSVAAWIDDDHLVFQVDDRGHIADPLAGRRPAAPNQVGGRGLLLAHHLSDLMRVHTATGGTSIRTYFAFAAPCIA
jgi:anti-sigma regulatory factor (Ser/Thr protein kinase)